jgi:hypothetical protein
VTSQSTLEGAFDKGRSAVTTDIREKRFEIVAYSGKIGCHGFWVDMTALKGNIVAERLRSGVDGKVM